MVYGPSFLYLDVSTVVPASRCRSSEYCEATAVGAGAAAAAGAVVAAGLAAAAAVGALVGAAAGALVGLAAAVGAAVGVAAVDEHALASRAPTVTTQQAVEFKKCRFIPVTLLSTTYELAPG